MSPRRDTREAAPPGRRTRFALGLAAWLWVAGILAVLLLAQALHVRMRALLFILGLVLLIRVLGWIKGWLGKGSDL